MVGGGGKQALAQTSAVTLAAVASELVDTSLGARSRPAGSLQRKTRTTAGIALRCRNMNHRERCSPANVSLGGSVRLRPFIIHCPLDTPSKQC